MVSHTIKKGNLKLTISINKEILEAFKEYCVREGLILSKQLENFMEKKLKNANKS